MGRRSGPRVLRDFDRQLEEAERQSAAAREEAERVARRAEGLRGEEAAALRELARLRLAMLGAGGAAAVAALEGASQRVRALLDQRGREAAEAEAEVARLTDAVAAAAQASDAAAEALEQAEAASAAEIEAARAALAGDPEALRRRAVVEAAARIAARAADKASLAQRDRDEKGRPYLDDPLFAYLWRRGFGTASYRGGGIVRALDAWVARVARYEPARRSFALLDGLPQRLAEHAARMREAAAAHGAELAAFERARGALPQEGSLGRERAAHEAAEVALQAAHEALAEAERRRAALLAGEDKLAREAAALLEGALAQESLRELREAAARTPTPQDDAIVARLFAARRERNELERQITVRRLEADSARGRVEELIALRTGLRQRDVGRSSWSLDGALLGVLVGQVLGGALSRDGFWGRMEEHRLPGPWGVPPPGPHGDSPWGGGGDFKTGGGFGGSDFRSGGSF